MTCKSFQNELECLRPPALAMISLPTMTLHFTSERFNEKLLPATLTDSERQQLKARGWTHITLADGIIGTIQALPQSPNHPEMAILIQHNTHNCREVFKRIVDQTPVSVVLTDKYGDIIYVNNKFTQISGYTLQEAIGQNPRILKSGAQSDAYYEKMWIELTSGNAWRGEFHNKNKSGQLYWEEVYITPLLDQSGQITHFMAIKEDINEKKALQSQLLHTQKLESVGQLAAGIAHEINTPIQFIGDNLKFIENSLGTLFGLINQIQELAADQPSIKDQISKLLGDSDFDFITEELPEAIKESNGGVERVSKIVKAMKDFSHIGSEDFTMVDLNQAIEDTITIASNAWKEFAEVHFTPTADLPMVYCDGGGLNQVFLNLLINATHAIEEEIARNRYSSGTILIAIHYDPHSVTLTFNDNGCGMNDETKAHALEPFFTTKEVGKGTGQGLAITYAEIVKKHHGKLSLDSTPGIGTTITIQLPINSSDNTEVKP